jgi:ADP-ribose pyrophosphatase YjhB (NUDIX family)
MTFIPEEEYQKIIKTMPVFCADFLIFAEKKYLLIKRKEEPVKDVYWVVGGRLRYKETMAELARKSYDARDRSKFF